MKWGRVGHGGIIEESSGEVSGFLGSYRHQIDEKGRLSLPAPFRRDADERPLVLVQVQPEALTLYPESTWQGVEERLLELLRRQPEARPHVLGITAAAAEVAPDKQGRILVPQRLLAAAGLGDAALLIGVIDRIEIWDPTRFEAAVGSRSAEFDRFTAQIFG
jgi:MraZ protein